MNQEFFKQHFHLQGVKKAAGKEDSFGDCLSCAARSTRIVKGVQKNKKGKQNSKRSCVKDCASSPWLGQLLMQHDVVHDATCFQQLGPIIGHCLVNMGSRSNGYPIIVK
jgi:hypothetical protein